MVAAELMAASAEVIAARTALMARGLSNPKGQDAVELALMSSEKTEALAASAAALLSGADAVGRRMSRAAADEADLALRALQAASQAPTPAAAAEAQIGYALAWWSRAAQQALIFQGELLKAQADALAPIHKTATANARRLRRR